MGLPAGTYQLASAAYLDAGNELGNSKVFGKVITTGNAVAQAAAWAALLATMDALSLGNRKRDTYDNVTRYDVVAPTNGAAREVRLVAQFHDTVNGQIWFDTVVPCVKIASISYVPGGKDVVDLTTTDVAALVAALVAFPVVNPYAQTDAVEVLALYVKRGQK